MHSKQQPAAGNYDSRTADKFVVRFPDGMRSSIEDLAKSQHRSMNSEIIARLERSIMDSELVERQTLLIQQLSRRIQELEQAVPHA